MRTQGLPLTKTGQVEGKYRKRPRSNRREFVLIVMVASLWQDGGSNKTPTESPVRAETLNEVLDHGFYKVETTLQSENLADELVDA